MARKKLKRYTPKERAALLRRAKAAGVHVVRADLPGYVLIDGNPFVMPLDFLLAVVDRRERLAAELGGSRGA